MKAIILFGMIFLQASSLVFAGSGTGKVTRIGVRQPDVVIFTTETHINMPACSTVGNDWALSLNTENGKAMYAFLLSVVAQGKSVSVTGTNECQAWADRETPLYITASF